MTTTTVIGLYAQDRSNPGELALALHATTPARLAAAVGERAWPKAAVALEERINDARTSYFSNHTQWAEENPEARTLPPHIGCWRTLLAAIDYAFRGWCLLHAVDAKIAWVPVPHGDLEVRRFAHAGDLSAAPLASIEEPPPRVYRAPDPPDDAGAERAKIVAWLRATHPAGCGSDYAASQIERGAHLDMG